MRHSAAVLCHDQGTLEALAAVLAEVGIRLVKCPSRDEALELVVAGRCSTLIVDFDLPGAEEVVRMASLLPPRQKPALLAVAGHGWPGTGEAFHSGVSSILYRPLHAEQIKNALKIGRKGLLKQRRSARYEMKTLVHLEFADRAIPAISIDIGEHGLAVQAAEPVPITSDLSFRSLLPGTHFTLEGRAEVIWASDQCRAGIFFSELSFDARKHLRHWLSLRRAHSKEKHGHPILPPEDAHVSFAVAE